MSDCKSAARTKVKVEEFMSWYFTSMFLTGPFKIKKYVLPKMIIDIEKTFTKFRTSNSLSS